MPSVPANRLLASLSTAARDSILQHATPPPAPLRMPLYAAGKEPRYAYFVTSGMASIVTTTEDGDSAEVGIVGNEGLLGSLHLIGPAPISTDAFMQLEGTVHRLPYIELQRLFRTSEEIRYRLLEFIQEQTLVVSHTVGCNRLHEAETRLSRWLLMARDRTGSDVLNFTHEFLGMMLGARRTTVSLVAAALQRLGAIEYTRGRVTILNGPQLEELACDCYQVTKRLHANLYRREVT